MAIHEVPIIAEKMMDVRKDILKAVPEITEAFDRFPKRILTYAELRQFLKEGQQSWKLPSASFQDLVDILTNETSLKKVELGFPYRPALRYTWGDVTTYELIQSLN